MVKLGEATITAFNSVHKVDISRSDYVNGGGIAIQLVSQDDGTPFATLTVNLPDGKYLLAPDEFFVKTWGENSSWVYQLLDTGLFEQCYGGFGTGYCTADIWKLTKKEVSDESVNPDGTD